MEVKQYYWQNNNWLPELPSVDESIQLVLVFGDRELIEETSKLKEINDCFPAAIVTGCTATGCIYDNSVYDDAITVTTLKFSRCDLKAVHFVRKKNITSEKVGREIVNSLIAPKLKYILFFSDGLNESGVDLVRGINSVRPQSVLISGGMAADGISAKKTYVIHNGEIIEQGAVAVGFYSDRLSVEVGTAGGWQAFGDSKEITWAAKNKIFTIDNKSALSLYKGYLGEDAKKLPQIGMFYPLELQMKDSGATVVRSVLSISEQEQSISFLGDISDGFRAKFLKATPEQLKNGAGEAAIKSAKLRKNPQFTLMVSCYGRKVVMQERVSEEIEAANQILSKDKVVAGFYSYGEIAPIKQDEIYWHNQTMTITNFWED